MDTLKQIYRDQPDFTGEPEHLNIFLRAIREKDISIWNTWRISNPEIRPDLKRAYLCADYLEIDNLHGIDFSGADLEEVVLNGADLQESNLSNANLRNADLSHTNLSRAKLTQAKIIGASLIKAIIKGADLKNADLSDSMIMAADLSESLLEGVNLFGTQFIHAKVNGVKGRYIFIDEKGEKRCPGERDFKAGELEKLLNEHAVITEEISVE